MAADSMAKASTHEPVGAKNLWGHAGWQLPAYIQHVANDLRSKGRTESEAIRLAVGIVRNWSQGHDGKGGRVHADTQAAAAKAMAEWEALKARAGRSHSLTAAPTATVDLAWNEALHPRKGGKFAPKGTPPSSSSSSALPPNMAANVRDFQKRMGLPVTGVIDTATAAKIKAEVTPKGPKGRKGKSKATLAKRARAAQRKTLGQHVATVNGLSTGQRATVRQRMPVPPTGYVWTASNNLRAVPLTAAQQAAPLAGLR